MIKFLGSFQWLCDIVLKSNFSAIFLAAAAIGAKELLPWYAVIIVNMFFVGILFGFLPVRVHALGYNPFITDLMVTVVSLSYLLVQPLAGHFADKIIPVKTIRFGLLLSALSIKEFGDMIGPLFIGVFAQAFGLTIGFATCGILGLFSLLLITRTGTKSGNSPSRGDSNL